MDKAVSDLVKGKTKIVLSFSSFLVFKQTKEHNLFKVKP